MTQKSNQVQLYVSNLLEDLRNGLTWYKSEDAGYGSIQEKYDATDKEVAAIKGHPALKGAEPTLRVFVVIDDTKDKKERKREDIPAAEPEQLFAVQPVVAEAQPATEDFEVTPEASVSEFLSL